MYFIKNLNKNKKIPGVRTSHMRKLDQKGQNKISLSGKLNLTTIKQLKHTAHLTLKLFRKINVIHI